MNKAEQDLDFRQLMLLWKSSTVWKITKDMGALTTFVGKKVVSSGGGNLAGREGGGSKSCNFKLGVSGIVSLRKCYLSSDLEVRGWAGCGCVDV